MSLLSERRPPRVHEVLGVPQMPGLIVLLLGAEAKGVVNHVAVDDLNRAWVCASCGCELSRHLGCEGRQVTETHALEA